MVMVRQLNRKRGRKGGGKRKRGRKRKK